MGDKACRVLWLIVKTLALTVHWYEIESERQFWVKQKRIALLLYQAKGATGG